MRSRRKGRISAPKLPVVCGSLAAEETRYCWLVIESSWALQQQVARGGLLVVHLGVGFAVKELPIEIEPRRDTGREQRLAVDAGSPDSIICKEVRKLVVWPKIGVVTLPKLAEPGVEDGLW